MKLLTTCRKTKKLQYRDKIAADIAASDMAFRAKRGLSRGNPPRPCVSYLCPYCRNWHLTTAKKKES